MVEPGTRARVLAAIEELKYYPDTHARSLVSGRSRILGLIVSDITNPFFPEVVKGFEDVATPGGSEGRYNLHDVLPVVQALINAIVERLAADAPTNPRLVIEVQPAKAHEQSELRHT